MDSIPNSDRLHYSNNTSGIRFYPNGSVADDDHGEFKYYVNAYCDQHARAVELNSAGRSRYIQQINC